jgi:hypothetical protein
MRYNILMSALYTKRSLKVLPFICVSYNGCSQRYTLELGWIFWMITFTFNYED